MRSCALRRRLVDEWHKHIVQSLRRARRALKPFATDPSAVVASAAALRTGVKAAELESERIEQTILEEWSTRRIAGWLRAQPAAAIAANIRNLFAIHRGSAERTGNAGSSHRRRACRRTLTGA